MRKRKPWKIIFIILLVLAISLGVFIYQQQYEPSDLLVKVGEGLLDNAPEIFSGEPKEVRDLRKQEVADTDTEGTSQEYYFGLLNEEEQRGYREMIDGIKAREKEFYLTIYDDDTVNKVYQYASTAFTFSSWQASRAPIRSSPIFVYVSFSPNFIASMPCATV